MAEMTKIEWATHTWNAIVGCRVKSKGCTNCYAMRAAWRLGQNPKTPHYAGLTEKVNGKPVWTGKVARAPRSTLLKPLSVKAPGLWFADSMSDTFYEAVPFDWVDEQFAVMALGNWHGYQILTKRPDRAADYLVSPDTTDRVWDATLRLCEDWHDGKLPVRLRCIDGDPFLAALAAYGAMWGGERPWPLPNVWIGVSVEDQTSADERREDLRRIAEAGWTTFVSYEPALGPVDWTGWDFVDQIISGGESGPDARPSHPDWHRATRDFCADHGVAFFFKQWGEWMPTSGIDPYCHGPENNRRRYPDADGISWLADGRVCYRDFSVAEHARRVRDGEACNSRAIEVDEAAIADFIGSIEDPERAESNPLGLEWMYRVGKKHSGRMLDGRLHDAMPETA